VTAPERVGQLAQHVAETLGLSCYPAPSAPGRGDAFAFVDAPTFTYETAARTYCPAGRSPRLRASVVIVAAGSETGQVAALLAAADRFAAAADAVPGWFPAGDAVPATFADTTPAYSFPMITT
jgi:hypothetical protein